MFRRSQLLVLICLMACGVFVALSVRADESVSSQIAAPARHAASINQQHRADSLPWWNQVAEETSDTSNFEILATSTGLVTDHKLVACGFLDSFISIPHRDLSLVAQRIRLQI